MNRRRALLLAGSAAAALRASGAFAQRVRPLRRIAIHSSGSTASYGHLVDEFRAGLKSLGYVEARDITLDIRYAGGRLDRLPALAAELLSLNPAVLVTHGTPGVLACQKATKDVPIVFTSVGDPIGQGFIKSYARPGGNITGVAFNEEINKKVYEVAKAVIPAATRIATLVNVDNPAQKHHLDDLPLMARTLGFESVLVHATKEEELESAFEHAVKVLAQALVISSVAPFNTMRESIAKLQFKHRIPVISGSREGIEAGGIASYSFPLTENWRRAAAIVDKILKGGYPADIPVEIPTRYEIGINLRTAKALGISVPQVSLMRAQRIIE